MGGLVGGLYATGRTADQLQDLLKAADWVLLLGGNTPYGDLAFRRKEDARDIPNAIEIGLKHGARLPPGLNSGHQVDLLIDRETLSYSTVQSFDDLPIPFRCVSTELVSGKAYVFRNGSLSDAMRATMSIPAVFAPVRRGDQIFVDGGLVDNLPTDEVRKMGADVVIGVHLQISPVSAKEIQSAFSILGRSVELVIAETAYDIVRQDDKDGLLIRIHEKGYAPPTLQPGVVVDGTQTNNVTFTAGARLTFMDVAGFRSEWRTDFQFGQTYGIASDLYRPFQPLGRWFFDPFVNANQYTFWVYKKSNPQADYRIDQVLGGVDVGYAINRFSEVRAGYGIGYNNADLRLGTPDFASTNGRVGAFHMRYVLDHTNEPVIPTRGYYIQSNFYYYDTYPDATEAFPSLTATVQYFRPIDRNCIFVTGTGGSTFEYRNTGVPQFFLGGVGRLTAYGLNELLGNQYFVGRVGYLREIATLPPFVGRNVYLVGYGEVGKMYGDPFGACFLTLFYQPNAVLRTKKLRDRKPGLFNALELFDHA